ncbi:hypothetical protein T492DRAFT_905738 [Pavlovales sp. CCMP2436]|nr:hypothetical protein T492DRAFT_905738 [Pavlovales sp. CCMP2436]
MLDLGFSQLADSALPPLEQLPSELQARVRQGYARRGDGWLGKRESKRREHRHKNSHAPPSPPRSSWLAPTEPATPATPAALAANLSLEAQARQLSEMGFEGALSLAALPATPALTDCSQRVQACCAEATPPAAFRIAHPPAVPLRVEEVDSDFVRNLPERIRSELPAILAQADAQRAREPAAGAVGAAPNWRAPDAPWPPGPPAREAAADGEWAALREEIRGWACADAAALDEGATLVVAQRLEVAARGLIAGGELERVEALVLFAARVLGPRPYWHAVLRSWLTEVDCAARQRLGVPLAVVRLARKKLAGVEAAQLDSVR